MSRVSTLELWCGGVSPISTQINYYDITSDLVARENGIRSYSQADQRTAYIFGDRIVFSIAVGGSADAWINSVHARNLGSNLLAVKPTNP